VQSVMEVTRVDLCSIFLYEPEWDQLVLTATSAENKETVGKVRLRMGEGITGWAALVGKPVSVSDAHSDERFKTFPFSLEANTKSMLVVPIVLFTNEKLVGVISIHTVVTRNFTENEIKFLETVAGEIAIAIENARLYEQTDSQLRQKVTELSTLQGLSAHIASTLDLTKVLSLIARQSAHLVRADAAAIYELHLEGDTLELVAEYDIRELNPGGRGKHSSRPVVIPLEKSRIARAVTRGVPMPLDPGTDAALGVPFANEGYSWLYCVPLVAPRGIRGGICLYNRQAKDLSDDQVRLLDAFAREAAIALENSRLYDAALRGLKVKSAMLQEMNHRVRNNLQTVAGLLSMQLRRMPGESDGATAVRESISRVQSIAVVHDLMVNGDSEIDSISIYELARKVADAVISTLTRPGFRLDLSIGQQVADRIRVGSHEATLLALLFNELISNAILHGFSNLDRGSIFIRVKCESECEEDDAPLVHSPQLISIEVEDDGSGLPEGFDPKKNGNLGLKIVETLVVSDLGGTFQFGPREAGPGTHAVFSFRPKGI
jgi:two-component system, sensor histidine kinase PdtaS